jgi:hypothetical protein
VSIKSVVKLIFCVVVVKRYTMVKVKTEKTKRTRRTGCRVVQLGDTSVKMYEMDDGRVLTFREAQAQVWGNKGSKYGIQGANMGFKGKDKGQEGSNFGSEGEQDGFKGGESGVLGKEGGNLSKGVITKEGIEIKDYGHDGGNPAHQKHLQLPKKTKAETRKSSGRVDLQKKKHKQEKKMQGSTSKGKGNVALQRKRYKERKRLAAAAAAAALVADAGPAN